MATRHLAYWPAFFICLSGASAADFLATREVAAIELPTWLTAAPGDPDRLFIVEQAGRVRIVKDGVLLEDPFLDIASLVSSGLGEYGMTCLAFHPDYSTNGLFFVTYADHQSSGVVARFQVTGDPNIADACSHSIVLRIEQPDPTHGVGWIGFGPDGYLYVAAGDGGVTTQGQYAQRLDSLLGKILRIDVNGSGPYAIPADNPFVAAGARGEIWALGLRNPWRCSFDRAAGDLWIADVGQATREEIDVEPAGGAGGRNYGWNCREATLCHAPAQGCHCSQPGLTDPVHDYGHVGSCAIIGGYVYRGPAIARLQGRYVFGDLCAGTVWAYDPLLGQAARILDGLAYLWSFGEDASGELYVLMAGSARRIVIIDCNENGIPDDEDIDGGRSQDRNANGIPDECDVLGDLDGDQLVGAGDLEVLLAAWGACPPAPEYCPADLDGDGSVGVTDLLILMGAWGP
jgi:glucose/arabinose dehydrogenase